MSDALLLVSYGSPERRPEILPFLDRMFDGRSIPEPALKKTVAEYEEIAIRTGRFSPLNDECVRLIAKILEEQQAEKSPTTESTEKNEQLPLYWGNLFWFPFLEETLREMHDEGIDRAFVFYTSPFESQWSRARLSEALERAGNAIGPSAPEIVLLPAFGSDPLYLREVADRLLQAAAMLALQEDEYLTSEGIVILFTAHSLPVSDAECDSYLASLKNSCEQVVRLISLECEGETPQWELVFQSRSGPPSQAWLEPDVHSRIQERVAQGKTQPLLIVPIGFLLENKETVYDLDIRTMDLCDELGIRAVRVATPGASSGIARMVLKMV